ncbi:hypothetical protein DENSPDRAFT_885239 [Dentipellis sp. KUC8613]|nr:hypothetical protein DENSPDRAFT_885239 [Dentipellis sp. KUC8613]
MNSRKLASILPALCTAAPILERAVFHNTDWPPEEAGVRTDAPALPANLFDRTAPRLRELDLSECGFLWSSISFASLVKLDIALLSRTNVQSTSNSKFDGFNACLCALASMPMLESLRLEYGLPELPLSPAAAFDALPTITLPNIHRFILTDSVLECAVALQHISTPALKGEDLSVCCTVDTAAGHGTNLIQPWIASRLHAASSVSAGSTSIQCQEGGFSLRVSDHRTFSPALQRIAVDTDPTEPEPGPVHAPAMGAPFLQISFRGFVDDEAAREIRDVIQLLPLECLEVLILSGKDHFRMGRQQLSTAFRGCAAVRHVRLVGAFATDFIRGGGFSFEFPAAKSVTLEHVDFISDELFLGVIIAGYFGPVQRFHLLDSRTDKQIRVRMARYAPEIFWDGMSDPGFWESELQYDDDDGNDEDDESEGAELDNEEGEGEEVDGGGANQ